MNNTRIFVSSTCFDLAAVREDLRAMITALGHEPLLSEFSSFPASPDENAIANCRRNVREHTDIMVLIVGGRRGSLDPDTGKPITNLEYEEAVRAGIPIYVFFSRPVLNLLRVWKKNPEADFTPDVDYPAVFAFIERIHEKGVWTYPFDRTEEIKEALRIQLSGLLRELLGRRRGGKIDPLPEFANETKRAKELALDKPAHWQLLLAAELLNQRLAAVRRREVELQSGLIYRTLQPLKASEVLQWGQTKTQEFSILITKFDPAYKSLTKACGSPGQFGSEVEILKAADRIGAFADELINWEIEITRAHPPEHLRKLVSLVATLNRGNLEKLASIPRQMAEIVAQSPQGGTFHISITIGAHHETELSAELERLKGTPEAFRD